MASVGCRSRVNRSFRLVKFCSMLLGLLVWASAPCLPAHAQTALTNGLVAYYPFNGNANDETGSGRNGAIYKATLTTDRFGNPNSAFSFDGVSSYILTLSDELPTANRTVSLWFKRNSEFNSGAPGKTMLSYGGDGSVPSSFFLDLTQSGLTVGAHSEPQFSAQADIRPGLWHHVVATVNGTSGSLYWNGTPLFTTQTAPFPPTYVTSRQLQIGVAVAPSGYGPFTNADLDYWPGDLDDIRIYNRALTSQEIRDLHRFEGPQLAALEIQVKSVQVRMFIKPGKKYQLQSSFDLNNWSDLGDSFVATTYELIQDFNAVEVGQYFRLLVID